MTGETRDADILAKALKIEEYQIKFFRIMAKLLKDKGSKRLFIQLAEEDVCHRGLIKTLLRDIGEPGPEGTNFSSNRYFGLDLRTVMKEGRVTVYKHAISVKRMAADFYSGALAEAEDQSAKDLLFYLIENEEALRKSISFDLCRVLEKEFKDLKSGVVKPNTA